MKIQPGTLKKLHVLLNNTNMLEYKAGLVEQYTNNRTNSSKSMEEKEAIDLCKHLEKMLPQQTIPGSTEDKKDRTRKRIISKFIEMGYTKNGKSDIARIKATLKEHWGKDFNDYDLSELTKIASVIEQKWLPHYYNKMQK